MIWVRYHLLPRPPQNSPGALGGEVAFPVLREPWNLLNPCGQTVAAALFSTRWCSSLEPAKWRSGNNEFYEHVMYNMQTVMHALCRHVPRSDLQADSVETCSYFSQEALSLWSAVKRVRRQKSKLQAATGRLAAMRHMAVEGLSKPIEKVYP